MRPDDPQENTRFLGVMMIGYSLVIGFHIVMTGTMWDDVSAGMEGQREVFLAGWRQVALLVMDILVMLLLAYARWPSPLKKRLVRDVVLLCILWICVAVGTLSLGLV